MVLEGVFPGRVPYGEALEWQKKLLAERQVDAIEDTILLLEHEPVITCGRRTDGNDILIPRDRLEAAGGSVFMIDRGGEATYHGPGQLVGYPIIHLRNHQRSVRKFVNNMEEVFIRYLRDDFGIEAARDEEHPGVWVGRDKITAIGISIHGGVTMHGFAFNVNTDLSHFQWIVPCGIRDRGVTSLERLTGKPQDFQAVAKRIFGMFANVYGYDEARETAKTPG